MRTRIINIFFLKKTLEKNNISDSLTDVLINGRPNGDDICPNILSTYSLWNLGIYKICQSGEA